MQCSGTLKQLVNVKIIHQYKTRALLHCPQEIATFSPRGIEQGKMNAAGNLSKQEVGHLLRAICTLCHKSFSVFLFFIKMLFKDAAPSGKNHLSIVLFLKKIKLTNPWNEEKFFNFFLLYYILPLWTLTLNIEFLTSYFFFTFWCLFRRLKKMTVNQFAFKTPHLHPKEQDITPFKIRFSIMEKFSDWQCSTFWVINSHF